VDVQEGQIVPAGGPLVEIATGSRIVARLGVEPSDINGISPGAKVALTEVAGQSPQVVEGKVDLITKRVNPDTRLVDVFVSLPKDAGLILEGYVRGELVTASSEGLIVPREAVLSKDDGYGLFTIKDGRAVEHTVSVGLQNDREALVKGEGLKPGDSVVVVGNYELEDGMAVSAGPAAERPAAGGPTTGEAMSASSAALSAAGEGK